MKSLVIMSTSVTKPITFEHGVATWIALREQERILALREKRRKAYQKRLGRGK